MRVSTTCGTAARVLHGADGFWCAAGEHPRAARLQSRRRGTAPPSSDKPFRGPSGRAIIGAESAGEHRTQSAITAAPGLVLGGKAKDVQSGVGQMW